MKSLSREYSQALYSPLQEKTFETAVSAFIEQEFPSFGGPMIIKLFTSRLKELAEQYYPPRSRLKTGQMLWMAVAKDEKQGWGKTMRKLRLVPVVLTIVAPEDIEAFKQGLSPREIRKQVVARLYREADRQGATLAESDLSLMFKMSVGTVCRDTTAYEKEHNCVLPRRGTIHDMGRSVTHKAQICRKRFLENKTSSQVARETYHSVAAVERYTTALEIVKLCLAKGLSLQETAFVSGIRDRQVTEYQQIIEQFGQKKPRGREMP